MQESFIWHALDCVPFVWLTFRDTTKPLHLCFHVYTHTRMFNSVRTLWYVVVCRSAQHLVNDDTHQYVPCPANAEAHSRAWSRHSRAWSPRHRCWSPLGHSWSPGRRARSPCQHHSDPGTAGTTDTAHRREARLPDTAASTDYYEGGTDTGWYDRAGTVRHGCEARVSEHSRDRISPATTVRETRATTISANGQCEALWYFVFFIPGLSRHRGSP